MLGNGGDCRSLPDERGGADVLFGREAALRRGDRETAARAGRFSSLGR